MTAVTATFAKNNLGEVWEMAREGPVEVTSNGTPVAVVLSPEAFEELQERGRRLGRPRRFDLLKGRWDVERVDEARNMDVTEMFKDYLPD